MPRRASGAAQEDVRVLPRPLPRHHLHPQDPPANPLLLLQPDSSLCADRLYGGPGLHPPARLRGEAFTRWVHG